MWLQIPWKQGREGSHQLSLQLSAMGRVQPTLPSPTARGERRGRQRLGWPHGRGKVQGEQELRRLTADLAAPICQLSVDTQPESEAGVGCQWAGGLG